MSTEWRAASLCEINMFTEIDDSDEEVTVITARSSSADRRRSARIDSRRRLPYTPRRLSTRGTRFAPQSVSLSSSLTSTSNFTTISSSAVSSSTLSSAPAIYSPASSITPPGWLSSANTTRPNNNLSNAASENSIYHNEFQIDNDVDSGDNTDFDEPTSVDSFRHRFHAEDALEGPECIDELCYLPQHTSNILYSQLPQFGAAFSACVVCKSYVFFLFSNYYFSSFLYFFLYIDLTLLV